MYINKYICVFSDTQVCVVIKNKHAPLQNLFPHLTFKSSTAIATNNVLD